MFYIKEHSELANRKELVAKASQIAHRRWNEMQKPPQQPPLTPQIIEPENAGVAKQPPTLPPNALGKPLQINFNVGQP